MKIAVIGLGYVGLPLLLKLSQLNFDVLGIDINNEKIQKLQKGILPFAKEEPFLLDYFKKEHKKGKISFASDFKGLSVRDLIFVCVDTPIVGKLPNYQSLTSALKSIAPNLKIGSIVIIESTIAPKTSTNLVIPILEKHSKLKINRDFFVAAVPERIRPNHIFEQLTTLPRVIGVSDKKISNVLKKIYSKITSGKINITDLTTTETVKTVENSFRDVNIAFANEVAIACEELGVNVWEVKDLVNKSPFHHMHEPGAGVGGHCIPKDPWLLASAVKKHQLELIETARKINDNMPYHVFTLIKKTFEEKNIKVKNANIAILGYSYVGNSDDTRNSPTEVLTKILEEKKIKYKIYDPLVKEYSNKSLYDIAKDADALVLMVGHDVFKNINYKKLYKIMRNKIIVDGRNFISANMVNKLGFVYKCIGNTSR